ncbi:MAG: sigma-70 family RNA polymerase sigma factor, partial [Cyanobacteriota bacterium]|nr:sigma-70 family RNA polymerase sigma factor [Cyanobacteriota bacterium]
MPNSNIQRRNRVVERHLELAQRLARNFSQRTGLDQDDLFQVAVLGLIKATKAYRSETNVPFEAFARPHVRGAILHYLRDSVAMVRLPRRLEEEAQRLSRTNRPRSSHEQWIQAT